MSTGMRIFFAVLSLLLTLTMLTGTIVFLFIPDNAGQHMYPVAGVCFLLTVLFSFFNYHDYQFFFGKKTAAVAPAEPTSNETPAAK